MPATHLWYNAASNDKVTGFQCQLTVPQGKDPVTSYYMACGFSRGYLGMQVNGPSERRLLFSVWDDGKGGKVDTIDMHPHALVKNFGGEGTGMQAILQFRWKPDTPYNFRVTAQPESDRQSTVYSGYSMVDEKWTLIASFRAPSDGGYIESLHSFLENFGKGKDAKKCLYGKQEVQVEGSQDWKPIKECRTTNTSGKGHYGFAVENDCFSMEIDGEGCQCCSHSNPQKLCLGST